MLWLIDLNTTIYWGFFLVQLLLAPTSTCFVTITYLGFLLYDFVAGNLYPSHLSKYWAQIRFWERLGNEYAGCYPANKNKIYINIEGLACSEWYTGIMRNLEIDGAKLRHFLRKNNRWPWKFCLQYTIYKNTDST